MNATDDVLIDIHMPIWDGPVSGRLPLEDPGATRCDRVWRKHRRDGRASTLSPTGHPEGDS